MYLKVMPEKVLMKTLTVFKEKVYIFHIQSLRRDRAGWRSSRF